MGFLPPSLVRSLPDGTQGASAGCGRCFSARSLMGSQKEGALYLCLPVLDTGPWHLQILHVKLLTQRPAEVLESPCLLRKKHPQLAKAANEFLLRGKHSLHL